MQTIAFFNLLQLEKPIRMLYKANLWFLFLKIELSADFYFFSFLFLKMSFQWNTEGFSCLYELSRSYNFISFYICLFSLSLLFPDLRLSDILWVTMRLKSCFGLCDSLTVVFSMETQRFISFLNLPAFFSLQCCRYVWWCVLYSTFIFMHDNTSNLHPRLEDVAETCLLVVHDWRDSGG